MCLDKYQERAEINRKSNMRDSKTKFLEVYSILKSQLLNDSAFEFTDDSRQWVDQMLDYNVPRGKLYRGLAVIDCYMALKEGEDLTDGGLLLASVLGWCIEWLQAYALVLDDVMDKSHTRSGRPCWYKLPKVGLIAINDSMLLDNQRHRILRMYFRDKPYYADLLDLFNEVEFQMVSGEMIDLITIFEGEKDLSNYSLSLYHRIVEYKSAYYSMYLPVACALILAGEKLENRDDVMKILIEITIYFQVQDDYQDCFGDPKVTGKVGTDIEDFKCTWFIVKALELANADQKNVLYENYGKADPVCVAKVKDIYEVLDLQGIYTEYEKNTNKKLTEIIKTHPNKALKALWGRSIGTIWTVDRARNAPGTVEN
ncbi:farnesyl pyrophosphate synthase-like [Mercurialis annua]|uniref:farnesyl pyrophosphate synthase-like n=1 Tax=Mercurialis annua TaxID=3986 RepID=UPI00215DF3B7|nr:farnesyl pyrophosphate synthase-like [Mercurialis annua]